MSKGSDDLKMEERSADYWKERYIDARQEVQRLRTGGLGNVSRALEVVDAHLVAIQSKLAEIDTLDSEDRVESTMEIVDHLDLIIGDVRAASADVTKHDCIPKGMVLVHPKYFEHLRNCEKFAVHEGQVKPTDWEKPG